MRTLLRIVLIYLLLHSFVISWTYLLSTDFLIYHLSLSKIFVLFEINSEYLPFFFCSFIILDDVTLCSSIEKTCVYIDGHGFYSDVTVWSLYEHEHDI